MMEEKVANSAAVELVTLQISACLVTWPTAAIMKGCLSVESENGPKNLIPIS